MFYDMKNIFQYFIVSIHAVDVYEKKIVQGKATKYPRACSDLFLIGRDSK